MPTSAERAPEGDHDGLTDRQVEVLVYRVLAALIAFLLAAAIAAVVGEVQRADDQLVRTMTGRPATADVARGAIDADDRGDRT